MYRPALVIGLGGTGVLTLRHLKSQLLASQARQLPPQVKLVAIDTVKDERQSAQISGETQIAALRTELEPGEYYWVGGDIYDFVRQIERKEQPHIDAWFQAQAYLETLPRASFTLERGAGQLRQFGRLAIFSDVAAPARASIYNLFSRAIEDIRRTGYFQTIDVFLVASVAGGTGAGMFVDMAYLVRQIAEQDHQLGVRLRGFLVLPEAFSAIPNGVKPSMRARAFACMRENKRFMVDFQYEHGYPMFYHGSGQDKIWRSTIKTKLFDFLYHIDGQSQRNPLTNVLPEYGVTAAIAEAVAAMLDKPENNNEDVYDRHTTNVIAQASQAGLTGGDEKYTSFDSAVGNFTIALPMHHITEWLSHRLALEALDRMLKPGKKDEDGFPTALAEDANTEFPGLRGRDAAVRFLEMAEVQSLHSGEKVAGTPFFQEVVRISHNYSPTDSNVVRELSSREAREWEAQIDPPGVTTEITAVRQRVQQTLSQQLEDEVPANQKGESGGSAAERILRGVESYKSYHLGREDMRTGQRVGGQYRLALDEYGKIQLNRFRLLLQVEMENILNGGQNPDDPAQVQKGGKLGYLLSWLAGLEEVLGRFLKAVNDSRSIREERGEKQAAVLAAQGARREMEEKPGGLFGGRRRQHYLDAEQALINIEKATLAEDVVRYLVDEMLAHTRQLRESAENWAKILGVGYDSLYARLLRGERKVRDAIAAEQKVPVREFVWDQGYLDQLYEKYTRELQAGVDQYLARFFWQQVQRRSGSKDIYGLQAVMRVNADEAQNRLGQENQDRNLGLLLNPAREVFAEAWRQESILKYLMTRRFTDPNALANHLAARADVLLSAQAQSMVPANYLHVAHGNDPTERQYLDNVRRTLEGLTQAKGKLSEIVNSADRFALRLVHTVDLIPLDQVDSYRRAETDYWTYAGEVSDGRGGRGRLGRETLHLFPAEVNATLLETRVPRRLQIQNRALHNDIVLQLEDKERFHLFVRCWAFNLIHHDRQENQGGQRENFWVLDLPPEATGSVRGPEPGLKLYLTRPAPGEPNIVEAMKTWNYRRCDVRPDISLGLPYDRALRAAQQARDGVLESGSPQEIDDPVIVERTSLLAHDDRQRFMRLWVERRYLKDRQNELEQTAKSSSGDLLTRDAAITMLMALEDDIESLNLEMDDLLNRI